MNKKIPRIQTDWLSKTLASLTLGCSVSFGICALFMLLPLSSGLSARAQLTMWLFAPIWLAIICCSYLFRSGVRAWLWLFIANLLIFTMLFILRSV